LLKILFAGLLWEGGTRCNDFLIIGQCFALQQKFTLARELKVILLYQPSQTRTIPRKSPTPLPCFAPSPLPPLSKVRCCRPKKFGRLPEGLLAPPSLCTTFLPPIVKGEVLSPKKIRATTGGIVTPPIATSPTLPKPHYPSKTTNTLASLVKGRWIDGKAQAFILLLSACATSAFFIHQTFLPSRRRDC